MPTIPSEEQSKPRHLRKPEYRGEAFAQAQPAKAAPSSSPVVPAGNSQPTGVRTAQRTMRPETDPTVGSKPLSACDDNPVVDSRGAAFVLGVSVDLLKKWRQRMLGPDYVQYGSGGPVRYEVKALLDFRDCYKIYLHSKRYGRREAFPDA